MHNERNELVERPNKSELKRERQFAKDIIKQLLKLDKKALKKISLSDETRAAIEEAHKFERIALKRQLGFIKGRLVNEDVEAIQKQLQLLAQPDREANRKFHQLEQWRDDLISEENDTLATLIQQFPDIDRQHLRQLVRNSQKEMGANKPSKSSRQLFQYLKSLSE